MARKRRQARTPGPGRNLAVRPGGGPHKPDEEKRASDRERREIEEQRDEAEEREGPDRAG
jgi:hypothetical protein